MGIFKLAKQKGIEDLELYTSISTKKDINIFNGSLESYQISDQHLLSVRGIINGKIGYVYTEDLEYSKDALLNKLIDNANIVASEDVEEIFAGSDKYVDLGEDPKVKENTYEEIMAMLNLAKQTARIYDKRVTDVSVSYSETSSEKRINNTKGLDLEKDSNFFMFTINVVASVEDQKTSAWDYQIVKSFSEFKPEEIAIEAAKTSISELGANPCSSGVYPVILKNSASTSILSAVSGMFYAEGVQKGMSPLKEKLNTKIVGDNITIVDDPFHKDGINRTAFDDEGVATSVTNRIENGKLNSYLYNLKSAKIDNVESTGNGFKGSIQSKVGTSASNLYIKEGTNSFDSLFEGIEKGVYITKLSGTHAGINNINGDFSLQSQGFMIENGKITKPIRLITTAGNFFEMLSNVDKLADDLKFDYNGVGSPSLLIKELPISGK